MAGIDLATAQAHLDAWLQAELVVASGQAYTIGNRSYRRADLPAIREEIGYWDTKVQQLQANGGNRGIRLRGATPIG